MPRLADLIPAPADINTGLNGTSNKLMLGILGNPRSKYSQTCQPVTNPRLMSRMVTDDVGPFRVTGLDAAIASLKTIMADIKLEQRAVYDVLGTAGMLCCRYVRGSTTAISNHSWGTAIDLTIEGVLDKRGNDKVQHGLALIAPIFNRHGWYWGASFPTEDGMHFEISEQLLVKLTGNTAADPAIIPDDLSAGDRGPRVLDLQRKLNKAGEALDLDGIFGGDMIAAVIAFQARRGLKADGIVGPATMARLSAA